MDLLWLDLRCCEINAKSRSPCPVTASVHATMKSALSSLTSERERLKHCLDHETCPPTSPRVVGLKNALATVCKKTHRHSVKTCQVFRFTSDIYTPLRFHVLPHHLPGVTHCEALTGTTSCWRDACPPEKMFQHDRCSHSKTHFLLSMLTCWLLSSHFELLCSPHRHISCWVLHRLADYSASPCQGFSNMWLMWLI